VLLLVDGRVAVDLVNLSCLERADGSRPMYIVSMLEFYLMEFAIQCSSSCWLAESPPICHAILGRALIRFFLICHAGSLGGTDGSRSMDIGSTREVGLTALQLTGICSAMSLFY